MCSRQSGRMRAFDTDIHQRGNIRERELKAGRMAKIDGAFGKPTQHCQALGQDLTRDPRARQPGRRRGG